MMEIIMYNVKSLDIRKNKLRTLPKSIVETNKTKKLWISDNPYACNCDMLWMKDWLTNTENVVEKKNVTCSGKAVKGKINHIN